jgi:alkyl hydroperoxide reductase subunit AhpC
MLLRLGDVAPDFHAQSTDGEISFHHWLGDGWGVLFSHPRDFTPVCTTELSDVIRLKPEFDRRGVKVIALSVDDLESHKGWCKDIEEVCGRQLNFPIIADPERKIADLYGMIHPNANQTLTVRTVYLIDPKKKVRVMFAYPASTGRNFEELLRTIDSLQLNDAYGVATPANWHPGEDCIIGSAISDDEAKKKFPKGYKAVKPYLRYTPQPNL